MLQLSDEYGSTNYVFLCPNSQSASATGRIRLPAAGQPPRAVLARGDLRWDRGHQRRPALRSAANDGPVGDKTVDGIELVVAQPRRDDMHFTEVDGRHAALKQRNRSGVAVVGFVRTGRFFGRAKASLFETFLSKDASVI